MQLYILDAMEWPNYHLIFVRNQSVFCTRSHFKLYDLLQIEQYRALSFDITSSLQA